MNVLLTGSTGFVGSCLLEHLTRVSSLNIETVSKASDTSRKGKVRTNHYLLDLADDLSSSEFLHNKKYDVLIHAAWEGLPSKTRQSNERNTKLSIKLFEKFIQSGGTSIVGLGSCLEYGDVIGQVDESDTGRNLTDFGNSKRLLASSLEQFKTHYIWLRPFYLYGPCQHSNSLISSTISHLSETSYDWMREPFVANDFVYIEDLGRLVAKLVSKELWIGEVNVGTSVTTQNISLVNLIRSYLGEIEYEFKGNGDIGLSANLTKIKRYLPDFEFSSLQEGVYAVMDEVMKIKG